MLIVQRSDEVRLKDPSRTSEISDRVYLESICLLRVDREDLSEVAEETGVGDDERSRLSTVAALLDCPPEVVVHVGVQKPVSLPKGG